MKMYIHNIFRSAAVLAVSAFSLASCAQVEEEMGGAVGYLCAPALEVDVTVDDLMETKALEGFTIDEPALSDFHYTVKDKDGKTRYDAVGLWEPLEMPVGPYSVEASHGSNGFGAPYFYGKTGSDAVIGSLEQVVPELSVGVRNALVKVRVDASFAEHFTLTGVELTSGGVTESFTAEEIASWYFVPSGVELAIKLIGENKAGVPKEFTHTITPAAKSANDIICRQDSNNVPVISLPDQTAGAWAGRLYVTPAGFTNISAANQAAVEYEILLSDVWTKAEVISAATATAPSYQVFKNLSNGQTYKVRARVGNVLSNEVSVTVSEVLSGVSVSSEHYKDADGNLAGTNSTLSVGLAGILKTLNDAGLLQLTGYSLSNGSVEVRSATAAGVMSQASGWPYLPQGAHYVLTINHKLSSETATVVSMNTGFNSPSPKDFISIKLTSYSSYDKYLDNDRTAANAMDAFTIKALGATWTVSSDLMTNANYSKSFTYNNDGQSVSTYSGNTCSLGDEGDLSVGKQYKVSASLTFDGEKIETGTKTHYITGLPYEGDFSDANKDLNWTQLNEGYNPITFGGTYVRLMPGKAGWTTVHTKITSKQSFILPNNVNVHFYNVMKKSGGLLSGYKLLFGTETIKSINASVTVDESKSISAGTYNVIMDSSYGSSNRSSYYEVSSIIVNYGSL